MVTIRYVKMRPVATARRHRNDVTKALSLNLDVKDCEQNRHDSRHDPHGLAFVEVRQHVRRGDVLEPLTQRPNTSADHVGDCTRQNRPRTRVPETDTVCVEESARAEKREGRVVRRNHGEIQDDEPGLAAVQ